MSSRQMESVVWTKEGGGLGREESTEEKSGIFQWKMNSESL